METIVQRLTAWITIEPFITLLMIIAAVTRLRKRNL